MKYGPHELVDKVEVNKDGGCTQTADKVCILVDQSAGNCIFTFICVEFAALVRISSHDNIVLDFFPELGTISLKKYLII